MLRSVLQPCCYGKALEFTIKNTRFTKKHWIKKSKTNIDQPSRGIQCKLAAKTKDKLTHNKNGQKMHCNANKDIVQLISNKRQRTQEIAAMLVFVFTGH